MNKKRQEDQINNSYFIQQEFKQKSKAYKPPVLAKKRNHKKSGRPSKVKVYTEEEIFLYKVKTCPIKMDV